MHFISIIRNNISIISILIISIIITSAPPQIIRPQIPEVGDPGCKVLAGYGEE